MWWKELLFGMGARAIEAAARSLAPSHDINCQTKICPPFGYIINNGFCTSSGERFGVIRVAQVQPTTIVTMVTSLIAFAHPPFPISCYQKIPSRQPPSPIHASASHQHPLHLEPIHHPPCCSVRNFTIFNSTPTLETTRGYAQNERR
jgi:hypothetical protein